MAVRQNINFKVIALKRDLGLRLDSKSANKEVKVVTPENVYKKVNNNQPVTYSESDFPLNKPNWFKCKKYFVLQNIQFWFFVTFFSWF